MHQMATFLHSSVTRTAIERLVYETMTDKVSLAGLVDICNEKKKHPI